MNFWRASCVSLAGLLPWPAAVLAAPPWEFGAAQTIVAARDGVFPHLDASGRSSIAVSSGTVAIVWEDNRDRTPRAYAAFRRPGLEKFSVLRLSGSGEAYDPVVAALPGGRFLFGWEEGGRVHVRTGSPARLEPAVTLSPLEGAQLSVASGELGLFAAWAGRAPGKRVIRVARLQPGSAGLTVEPAVQVTTTVPEDQSYPVLAVLRSAVLVVWEDRRDLHTVLYHSRSIDGRKFSNPRILNELRAQRSQTYGRGTGVARPVLARLDADRAVAAWLDKRDFEGGYDVYAALAEPGGTAFSRNEKVQDEFGNNIGQWHAAVAAAPGSPVAAAWDDDRDGSADIWLSWRDASGWSADYAVPGAAGPGPDHSPVLAMEEGGTLHLAWISQPAPEAPGVLRYIEGRRITTP